MQTLHFLNLILHVTAGVIALFAGVCALLVRKGGYMHFKSGRCFQWMIVVVILTGLIGVFVFSRNSFLLVITMLSGYNCFSGIRVLRLRGRRPVFYDAAVSVLVMISAFYYLYSLYNQGLYWSPVVIYSTMAALFIVTVYDLLKWVLPISWLEETMLYEHVYKMISAFSAITSAFCGTVFPNYKPYSQILPSVVGLVLIIVTFMGIARKRLFLKRNAKVQ